jgi:hypothetical protein
MIIMTTLEDMKPDEIKDAMYEKSHRGWIKAWFAIEMMAVDKEVTETSLKEHIDNLCSAKEVFVFEKKFKPVDKVEKPMRDVAEAYCQVAEVSLFVKDLFTLINIVAAFGPSSIEILEPKEIKVRVDEVQSMANLIAGLMHQFASAGVGGIVFTPKKGAHTPSEH